MITTFKMSLIRSLSLDFLKICIVCTNYVVYVRVDVCDL